MPRISQNHVLYGVAGLTLLLAVTFGTLTYLNSRKVNDLETQITAKNQELQQYQIKARKLDALKADNVKLQRDMKVVRAKLPPKREIEGFLDTLSQIRRESGINISRAVRLKGDAKPATTIFQQLFNQANNIQAPVAPQGQMFEEIQYRLSMDAGFFELVTFINKLENYKRFVQVNDIDIKGDTKGSGNHTVNMTLSIFAYAGEVPKTAP
ncbi:MAG: type 4a pilus biogenesis protein PilO [Planctomycetota bacterium]